MANSDQDQVKAVDSPWDEERWDQFIREKDVRVEECVRLLEKYANHPNREEKALRGMGLTLVPEEGEQFPEEWAEDEDSHLFMEKEETGIPSEEQLRDGSQDGHRWHLVRKNPAYIMAHKFCQEMHRHLPERSTRSTRPLIEMMSHAYSACAKLAGGLGGGNMGEDPAMIIAYCKRALTSVQRCLESLREIENGGILPMQEVAYLRHRVLEVREEVITQISGFRALGRARARRV